MITIAIAALCGLAIFAVIRSSAREQRKNARVLPPYTGAPLRNLFATDDTEDGRLYQTANVVCAVCSYRWQAVFPIEVVGLECKQCGHMNPVPV